MRSSPLLSPICACMHAHTHACTYARMHTHTHFVDTLTDAACKDSQWWWVYAFTTGH